jgi:hypothetical protein
MWWEEAGARSGPGDKAGEGGGGFVRAVQTCLPEGIIVRFLFVAEDGVDVIGRCEGLGGSEGKVRPLRTPGAANSWPVGARGVSGIERRRGGRTQGNMHYGYLHREDLGRGRDGVDRN